MCCYVLERLNKTVRLCLCICDFETISKNDVSNNYSGFIYIVPARQDYFCTLITGEVSHGLKMS